MLIVAICEDEPYFQVDLKNMAEQYSQESFTIHKEKIQL